MRRFVDDAPAVTGAAMTKWRNVCCGPWLDGRAAKEEDA
jgi:hypothetical protein